MIFEKTKFEGVYIVRMEPKEDSRGSFARVFCKEELKTAGIDFDVKQVNQALTKKRGTLRGLHYQKEPKAEAKLVRCFQGKVYDLVVDLRLNSSTYKKWLAFELSDLNTFIYIPKGLAHGYETLSDNCWMEYFMSEFYAPEYEAGLRWDDPALGIDWPVMNPFLSEKDKNWPLLT